MMKTLLIGLGNPILGDDGVGIYVVRAVRERYHGGDLSIVEASLAGLDMLDMLAGYDRVIVVDAIQTTAGKAGQIFRLAPADFDAVQHSGSPHDIDFTTALKLGEKLGMSLPREIVIFGIEAGDVTIFSEECTPRVQEAIPAAVDMVIGELDKGLTS
ncbi:MAG: hydrogenase maturation protease [Chloroflexota bacterium]